MTHIPKAIPEPLGRLAERLLGLAAGRRLYLVGGTIRDWLLGRPSADFDFAVSGSGLDFATAVARAARGALVVLSKPDDEARVVLGDVTLDFNGFGDRTIEADLARRDFTANAIGAELTASGLGPLLDPHGGQSDIQRRFIRPVSDGSLESDPLRLLRAFRLAAELGFTLDPAVLEQGRRVSLKGTAAERIGAELLRVMEAPGSLDALRSLYELGRLSEILPELVPILDDDLLREHSFRTYLKIEELIEQPGFFSRFEPEWRRYFDEWGADAQPAEKAEGPPADALPSAASSEPSAVPRDASSVEQRTAGAPYRRALLKLAGLLHDIAKPETRFVTTEGDMHFYGHDSLGAKKVGRVGRDRLRLSRAQAEMLATLTQEHMRLHLLATAPDLSDRAIRRYFRDLGDEAFGLMILCYADGWATAGRTSHLEDTVTRMIQQKRAEDAKVRVARLVDGTDLIALGMPPGPAFKVIL
ncbi:MAG: HD domain-containing protein, partial [bacterium]